MLTELHVEAEENIPFVLLDERRSATIQAKWRQCREQGQDWLNRYWVNNTLRDFQRRVRQASIDTGGMKATLHDLRKSCIQNWADYLPMNVVKELAGHSSIETTAKFYNKVTPEHMRQAKQIGETLLGGDVTDHKLTFSGNLGEK